MLTALEQAFLYQIQDIIRREVNSLRFRRLRIVSGHGNRLNVDLTWRGFPNALGAELHFSDGAYVEVFIEAEALKRFLN